MGRPVSAIIITRGALGFLSTSLRSALLQPETAEVVVAHDRRPGEPELPAALVADPRVRVVPTTAPGTAGSRNAGALAARGPWLAFLDDDDAWLPGHLATAGALLDRHPTAVVAGTAAHFVFDPDGTDPLDGSSPGVAWGTERPAGPLTFRELLLGNRMLASAVVVAADRIGAVPQFDETLDTLEDYDLWMRLRVGHDLVATPVVTALIRKRAGSMSRRLRSMAHCGRLVFERGLAAAPPGDTLGPAERRRRRAALLRELAYGCLAEADAPAARRAAWAALAAGAGPRAALYLLASWIPRWSQARIERRQRAALEQQRGA